MKKPPLKKIQAVFYRSEGGGRPVREWLLTLEPEDRRIMKGSAMSKKVSPIGQSFDDFLQEQGIADEVRVEAQLRVLAWMIEERRKKIGLSKAELAKQMETSRSQLDRILHPEKASLTVEVLDRAARAVGLRLKLGLEPLAA